MNYYRLYFLIIVLVLLVLSLIGFVLPTLFSAKSNISVLTGLICLLISPVLVWDLVRRINKEFQK